MKVRLKDIAQLAKVSVAAVSMVLNDPATSQVSEAKKKEILKIAKDLNYRPNIAARGLVKKQYYIIGLVIPDIKNPFFSSYAKWLEIKFREKGYALIIMNTDEDYRNDLKTIDSLTSRNVDGIIIALSGNSYGHEKELVDLFSTMETPYILVDRIIDGFNCNRIIFNNKEGMYIATKYLIDRGHEKIGHISVKNNSLSGYYRYLGYRKALRENNIDYREEYVKHGSFNFETGYQLAGQLLKEDITALVCANDLIAFGVLKRAKEMGVRIPEDISIVGYDNLDVNDMFVSGLTTIDQDIEVLVDKSIDMMMDLLENKNKQAQSIELMPTIKVRNSVKNLIKKN